jgi:signal transduction histidine kinase
LNEIRQVLDLSRQQADLSCPVKIQGVVTYADPSWGLLFVQDGTGGIYVDRLLPSLKLQTGDLITLEGSTAAGLFSPIIDAKKATFLQRTNLPPARSVDIDTLNAGAVDAQWVELTGNVRRQEWVAGRLRLELGVGQNRAMVWVQNSEGYSDLRLTEAQVRVRGTAGALFDARELKGFHLYVPSLAEITVIDRPPDAFAEPVVLGRDLARYMPWVRSQWRVHVQGVVTMQWPGRFVFIHDASGGIHLQTDQTPALRVGERVDAVGFKVLGTSVPQLESVAVCSLNQSAPVQPVVAKTTELHSGKFNQELVQLDAHLLFAQAERRDTVSLLLTAGEQVFTALLHSTNTAPVLAPLHPGNLVRVTGVCQWSESPQDARSQLTMWLRSPEDILVLASGHSNRQALALGGVVTLAAVAGGMLVYWMRRRARRQLGSALDETRRELRSQIEQRERISQDLHDNIMQSIYAVGLGLEDCRRALQKAPALAEQRLTIAIGALNSVIQDVRHFIGGLEPRVVSGAELKTALKSLALTAGDSSSQVAIQVEPSAAHRLTSHQATQLLNIAKEAMSNSLRHANATRTLVALGLHKDHMRLEVSDDGRGFDPKNHSQGSGLRNVAARARELGARLDLISSPNNGTRLIVDLPPFSSHDSGSST